MAAQRARFALTKRQERQMSGVSVAVEGADALAEALKALGVAVSTQIVKAALQASGEPIRASAARRMARSADPPHAADNIAMTLSRSGHALAIGPTRAFAYWFYQEFGTKNQPAQPALRPAFDEEGLTALETMRAAFWDGIEKELPPTS
jgi:HK97 gp10 family phage protein